jgi:hypothetical protein
MEWQFAVFALRRKDMKKLLLASFAIIAGLLLASCGSPAGQSGTPAPGSTTGLTAAPSAPAATPSATPDLCTQAQLPETVKIVNGYVHQFDNYATLAFQLRTVPNNPNPALVSPLAQLPQLIASMKSIRTALQQQLVPPCLTDLKHYALQYMDTVVLASTTYQTTGSLESLSAGINLARQYNDQYANELARLLGVTLAPENVTPVAGETATLSAGATVMNPGPNPLNLHVAPSLTSQSIAMLEANESARALGKSSNDEWIQIEVPGQPGARAWVYASLVQYTSGDASILPVATP